MEQLEARCGVPTLGVLPYVPGLVLDAEDSLHRLLGGPARRAAARRRPAQLDVVVLRLPRLSNFTDFDPLLVEGGVAVRFVDHPSTFGDPDLIVLPGTKSTVADLEWVRTSGLLRGDAARAAVPRRPRWSSACAAASRCWAAPSRIPTASSPPCRPCPAWVGCRWSPGSRPRRPPGCGEGTGPGGVPVQGYEIRHGRTRPRRGGSSGSR